ncbi:MAG: ABC transporter ATP-binding protein [Burkholderiaceae bacterium]
MPELASNAEVGAALLVAENLEYRYPRQAEPALQGVSLTLARGQSLGLLGPNGSGKSTLINVLIGVLAPQGGSVRRAGERVPVIAWVPQDCAFYPQLSCRENLQFFVTMLALPRDEQAARVDRVIVACVLQEFVDKPARHCSGGVRRRLNIAIALLQQPEVLLLDEPTVGVDPQSRAFLLEQVRALAQQGTAIVYATHYMEEVTAACNEILLLDRGKVLASGGLRALLQGTPGSAPFDSLEALFMHHTNRSLRD